MGQKEHEIKEPNKKQKTVGDNKRLNKFIANLSLLVLGLAAAISGLIIQVHYHIGHNSDTSTFLSFHRITWYYIHVYTSIAFFLIVIYHVRVHTKWYKNIFSKKPLPNKRATVALTILMAITAITGFTPLLIYFIDSDLTSRFIIIEIHDKIAVLFLLIAILHTKKKLAWYTNVLRNQFNKQP